MRGPRRAAARLAVGGRGRRGLCPARAARDGCHRRDGAGRRRRRGMLSGPSAPVDRRGAGDGAPLLAHSGVVGKELLDVIVASPGLGRTKVQRILSGPLFGNGATRLSSSCIHDWMATSRTCSLQCKNPEIIMRSSSSQCSHENERIFILLMLRSCCAATSRARKKLAGRCFVRLG